MIRRIDRRLGRLLIAGVLLWLTSSRDVMGESVNGPIANSLATLGLVLLLAMAGRTAFVTLPDSIQSSW